MVECSSELIGLSVDTVDAAFVVPGTLGSLERVYQQAIGLFMLLVQYDIFDLIPARQRPGRRQRSGMLCQQVLVSLEHALRRGSNHLGVLAFSPSLRPIRGTAIRAHGSETEQRQQTAIRAMPVGIADFLWAFGPRW
jgi:hypothetical protein